MVNGLLMHFPIQQQLSEIQKQAIHNIYQLYDDDVNLKNENISEFIRIWDGFDSLKILHQWWDFIPQSFNITAVGKVLAHANAQRCDPTLPALD